MRFSIFLLSLAALTGCRDNSPCTLELGLYVSPLDTTLNIGQSYQLRARYSSCGGRQTWPATDATYLSQDPNVATVDAHGRVTSVAQGLATLAVNFGLGGVILNPTVTVRP